MLLSQIQAAAAAAAEGFFESSTLYFCGPAGAAAGKRVARVIGVSHYDAVQALPNPARDAAAVASLKRLGFEVTPLANPTKDAASGRELRTRTGHAGEVMPVAFSPDSRAEAVGCVGVDAAAGGAPLVAGCGARANELPFPEPSHRHI